MPPMLMHHTGATITSPEGSPALGSFGVWPTTGRACLGWLRRRCRRNCRSELYGTAFACNRASSWWRRLGLHIKELFLFLFVCVFAIRELFLFLFLFLSATIAQRISCRRFGMEGAS